MNALPRDDDGRLTAYAWPGGYPVYYVTADSGALCPDCARMAEAEGLAGDPEDPQWYIVAADINWEDADLYCDHCSERIESAYADDDPLIMCEACGADILQSEAHWRDTDTDGRVPLCARCHSLTCSGDEPED